MGGRRAEHKDSTRRAILAAAGELFASQGFEATTVRQVAEAAGVTERTYFRYFASKEDLRTDSLLAWIAPFSALVRGRPACEPALVSVREGLIAFGRTLSAAQRQEVLDLYADGPAVDRVRARRAVAAVTGLESALHTALVERGGQLQKSGNSFELALAARVSVAVLRSVALHHSAERRAGRESDLLQLCHVAFGSLLPPLPHGDAS